MRLADDLFLLALDDRTGRLRLESTLLSVALAGGLLAELLLARVVMIDGDEITVRPRTSPPDALTHAITELLVAEPQHTLRIWLRYLATDAVDKVAARLTRDKILTVEATRSLLRGTTVCYRPVDVNKVAWRAVRISRLIDDQAVTDWPDCTLTCLAHAVGLTSFLLRDATGAGRTYLDWLAGQLHRAPGLTALVAGVASVAGSRVVAHHR